MTANVRTAFRASATGTPPRSCGRIFTCGEAQIATSPFIYRGVGIFMPEKVGNLQPETAELVKRFGGAVDIPAFGGRLEVNLAPSARVTSVGGLAHFAMFLRQTGLFDRLCRDFPVRHRSNNSCSNRDILGTAAFAILLGKTRHVHIEALRHNEAARELLGLGEVVSEAERQKTEVPQAVDGARPGGVADGVRVREGHEGTRVGVLRARHE